MVDAGRSRGRGRKEKQPLHPHPVPPERQMRLAHRPERRFARAPASVRGQMEDRPPVVQKVFGKGLSAREDETIRRGGAGRVEERPAVHGLRGEPRPDPRVEDEREHRRDREHGEKPEEHEPWPGQHGVSAPASAARPKLGPGALFARYRASKSPPRTCRKSEGGAGDEEPPPRAAAAREPVGGFIGLPGPVVIGFRRPAAAPLPARARAAGRNPSRERISCRPRPDPEIGIHTEARALFVGY